MSSRGYKALGNIILFLFYRATLSIAKQDPEPQIAATTRGRGRSKGRGKRYRVQPRAHVMALIVEPYITQDDEIPVQVEPVGLAQVSEGFILTLVF